MYFSAFRALARPQQGCLYCRGLQAVHGKDVIVRTLAGQVDIEARHIRALDPAQVFVQPGLRHVSGNVCGTAVAQQVVIRSFLNAGIPGTCQEHIPQPAVSQGCTLLADPDRPGPSTRVDVQPLFQVGRAPYYPWRTGSGFAVNIEYGANRVRDDMRDLQGTDLPDPAAGFVQHRNECPGHG